MDASPALIDMQTSAPPPVVRRARVAAIACLLGLIALCVAWELWLAPVRPGGSWLALKALPLCIPLAGLLKNRMYTFRWLSLMLWLYVCEGLVRASSDRPPSQYWALLEVALCLCLFTACVVYIRQRLKSASSYFATALQAPDAKQPPPG